VQAQHECVMSEWKHWTSFTCNGNHMASG